MIPIENTFNIPTMAMILVQLTLFQVAIPSASRRAYEGNYMNNFEEF